LDGETRVCLPTMALSLWAPWAFSILHLGKPIENRSIKFPRHFIGEFWLHCSLWPGGRKPLGERGLEEMHDQIEAALACCTMPRQQQPEKLKLRMLDEMRGKIVGRVTVTGYVEQSDSPWFVPGSLGLGLANPVPLAKPVAASGALGWWRVLEPQMQELAEVA
jgi:hypothetical protein